MKTTNFVTLPDNRKLAYAEFGKPDGHPVIYFYVRPWDFKAAEIQIPVQLFHGEQDTKVPISMARKAVDRLPTARLFTYPNEGHISIGINQFEAIAKALKGDRSD